MKLTTTQLATLKTFINSNGAWAALPNDSDSAVTIAAGLNALASPDFWVYKTSVSNEDIGDAMNGTEVAGLSSLQMQRAQMLSNYSGGSQNPSRQDRRDAFDSIFSGAGGATTRASLAVLWRRQARVIEKVFATGTGSTGSPATLAIDQDGNYVEGLIDWPQVQKARA